MWGRSKVSLQSSKTGGCQLPGLTIGQLGLEKFRSLTTEKTESSGELLGSLC